MKSVHTGLPWLDSGLTWLGSRTGRAGYHIVGMTDRFGAFPPLSLADRLTRRTTLDQAVAGRIVMVTGASSGIGRAVALKTAAAGAEVLLVARRAEILEEVKAEIEQAGGVAHVHACDLGDVTDVERMAAEVLAIHGHVDILVNNAARSIRRSIELSYDRFHDYERVMATNFFGPLRLILALLPTMRERGFGHIVTSSTIGMQAKNPRFSAYFASKAAIEGFTDTLASEARADGVRVSTFYVPIVRTPMIAATEGYSSGQYPTLSPQQAADIICDAMVYRPKRIWTLYSVLGLALDLACPHLVDGYRSRAYQSTADSPAARGQTPAVVSVPTPLAGNVSGPA